MCKEDVRIGRAAEAVQTYDGGTVSTATLLAGANPNRKSLVVSVAWVDTTVPFGHVAIRAGSGTGPVLGISTVYHPIVTLTVETHGDGVTRAIWMTGTNTDDQQMYVTEIRWNAELKDL